MTTASWPLQEAIYTALDNAPALAGLVSGVYDHVPEEADFPYVQLGEATAADWSSKSFAGAEHTITLHIWSQDRGYRRTKSVMAAVHDVLHEADLAVAGHTLVALRFISGETLRDPDGITHHGVMRFRALTHDGS